MEWVYVIDSLAGFKPATTPSYVGILAIYATDISPLCLYHRHVINSSYKNWKKELVVFIKTI